MKNIKKVAMAAVSVVMAGTMLLPLAACGGKKKTGFGPGAAKEKSQAVLDVTTDESGKLSYPATTTLKFDVGDNSSRNVAFTSGLISGTINLPDGNEYSSGSLKPAWKAMSEELGFKLEATFATDKNKYQKYSGDNILNTVDLFTDSVSTITTEGLANQNLFLDLSLYLNYMPNFKSFLEANPASYMSLVGSTTTGAILYAPYYDGNNDIEKYTIAKTNWVSALLDATTDGSSTTFAAQGAGKGLTTTSAYASSFMGTTGKYKVATTKADGNGTTTLVVNYDAALAAAKKTDTDLSKALAAAGVTVSSLTSGNIVDLQNAAINTSTGNVTGAQLLKILQAYVDVAYQKEDGSKFYTKRSDVFNGYDAGWDADLVTALYRCVVTNPTLLKSNNGYVDDGGTPLNLLYGLVARQNTMQRQSDVLAFAGQLYGVRGLESRYEYSYVDASGGIQDARNRAETYEAMDKLNKLVKEGLVYTGDATNAKSSYYSTGDKDKTEALMLYDYVNTQTPAGFQLMGKTTGYAIEDGYYFTPIVNAISKWDVDGKTNNGAETVMRFTESWRSVKNSGFAIPYDSMKNKPDKLAAMLAFIDYLYSPDGQIAMTYGPMASDSTGTGGFWYNPEATDAQVAAGKYFEYKGKKYYSETYYAKQYQPTLTENTLKAYYGESVNGVIYNGKDDGKATGWQSGATLNYTNFARYVIGSALALGNKLQSFEYQATSDMGKYGASVVDTALDNGTLKHVFVTVDECKGNLWYLISPSALPLTTAQAKDKKDNANTLNNEAFSLESGKKTNYLWNIIVNGLGNSTSINEVACGATGLECVQKIQTLNIANYVTAKRDAFSRLRKYFNF